MEKHKTSSTRLSLIAPGMVVALLLVAPLAAAGTHPSTTGLSPPFHGYTCHWDVETGAAPGPYGCDLGSFNIASPNEHVVGFHNNDLIVPHLATVERENHMTPGVWQAVFFECVVGDLPTIPTTYGYSAGTYTFDSTNTAGYNWRIVWYEYCIPCIIQVEPVIACGPRRVHEVDPEPQ